MCRSSTPPAGHLHPWRSRCHWPQRALPRTALSCCRCLPPALAAVQGTAAADAEGSSSMAPSQRRYHTRVGPNSACSIATQASPEGPPPAQEGPDLGPRGVIHFETSGATLTALSGHFRSPGPIPCIYYHAAAFFPCSPIPENVDYRGRRFPRGGLLRSPDIC